MTKEDKILVSGGAGFIGSHLIDHLLNKGYLIRVVDDLSTGNLVNIRPHLDDYRLEFIKGDIRDAKLLKDCLKGISKVVHLAAQISVPLSIQDPQLTMDVNVAGTGNLLKSSLETGVKRFVFASSCAVYGEPTYLPIDEKHPTNPISPYAESKLMAEELCLSANMKTKVKPVVLRFFNVYGARQGVNEYSGVITKFVRQIEQKLPLVIFGDGSQTRDFVNVEDVVGALMLALESEEAIGGTFNVGYGVPISIQKLAETFLYLSEIDLPIQYNPPRTGDILSSYSDISKAKQIISYNPTISLNDGLRSLISCK